MELLPTPLLPDLQCVPSGSPITGTDVFNTVAYSPDGSYVVSGSGNRYASSTGANDFSVGLWTVVTRTEDYTFKGHSGAVLSVAFSADGKSKFRTSLDDIASSVFL